MTDQKFSLPAPCLKCGKTLEDASGDPETYNQPYDGTKFSTSGHYGSTVFDPFESGVLLEIVICDDCLKVAGREGRVFLREEERPAKPKYSYSQWSV